MLSQFFQRYPNKSNRFLEIIIPLFSWGAITMPFWLSFSHPAVVAYLIISFDIYWFYKSASLGLNGIRSYLKLMSHSKMDWQNILSKDLKISMAAKKIYHLVIIPAYKEPEKLLQETLANLRLQAFSKDQIFVCLALEKRDNNSQSLGDNLQKEFQNSFRGFWVTFHHLETDEVAGKSSNMAYAGRKSCEFFRQKKIGLERVIVTSCDADARLHPQYLSCVTCAFLSDPDRLYNFFQSAILFYNNIWRIPLLSRVANTIGSMVNLALLSQPSRLINFSTYSLSLATVARVGFWGKNIIPEDYHLFFKTFFALGEKVRVIPIFLPTLADAAESKGFLKTMINQYEQHKRWAWGISDLPFVIRSYFLNKKIPFLHKTYRLLTLFEQHLLWSSNWFILTLGSTIPPLINPVFKRTVLGHNLPKISSAILTASILFLLIIIYLDSKIKPPKPKPYSRWKIPFLYLQWLTLPIVGLFLSALPGLDAHTRLMLGKRLEYRATEKIR